MASGSSVSQPTAATPPPVSTRPNMWKQIMPNVRVPLALLAILTLCLPQAGQAGPIRDRIFQPDQGWPEPGPWRGTPPEAIAFRTHDGLELHSWLWRGKSGRLILYF